MGVGPGAACSATGAADETVETDWNRPTGVISTNPNDPFVQQPCTCTLLGLASVPLSGVPVKRYYPS